MDRIILKDISLDSSNVAASAVVSWLTGTTYVQDDIRVYRDVFPSVEYKSLVGSNQGNIPPDSAAFWLDQGGINQHAMFDHLLNTQTENANTIQVVIDGSHCDKLCLFNLDATDIDIELTDNNTAAVVQTSNTSLLSNGIYKKNVLIPVYNYADSALKITINKSGGTAKCGMCAVGVSVQIGSLLWDFTSGIIDFGRKSTDAVGRTYMDPGNVAKTFDGKLLFDTAVLDAVFDDMVDARGVLSVWDCNNGDTGYEIAQLYGFPKSWEIEVNFEQSTMDFFIEGVI